MTRLREMERKFLLAMEERDRVARNEELNRIQEVEEKLRESLLLEERKANERAKADQARAEETLKRQELEDLKAAQD